MDDNIHYASDSRIDSFVSFMIISLGLGLLISPLWILALVDNIMKRLAIITTFVVVFLSVLSLTTLARPFENLAAAAALVLNCFNQLNIRTDEHNFRYAAVLVVFLQIPP